MFINILDVIDCRSRSSRRLVLIEIDTDCIEAYFAPCKNKYEFWREPTSKFFRNILNSSKLKQQVRSISDSFCCREAILTILFLTCLIIITVIGNILVILSVLQHTPLKILSNYYVVSLAVADLTVSLHQLISSSVLIITL